MANERLNLARGDKWLPAQPVSTMAEAGAFVESVGFALLFPAAGIVAPSLWEAIAEPDAEPFANGMGEDESRLWEWKDELPRQGVAWYGRFLHRRGSLLSPRLLAALYPGSGQVSDHRHLELSAPAHEIAETLVAGPMTTRALREIIDNRLAYQRAMAELHRHLLVTSYGVRRQPSGWPAGLVELTCRAFDVGAGRNPGLATEMFVATMISATARELSRAYGWPLASAREELDRLVAAGVATRCGRDGYCASP